MEPAAVDGAATAAAAADEIEPYLLVDAEREADEAEAAAATQPAASSSAAALDSPPMFTYVEPTLMPPFPLARTPSTPSSWASPPPHAIGHALALRAMRDALALQLARRGFDGLRQSALWLVTELTADFLRAMGAQLRLEAGAPPQQLVRRVQRHSNMRRREEWVQAQRSFARVSEPPGTTTAHGGSRALGPAEQKQVDPKLAPPSVAPLYAAMKGAWNYKNSGAGRAAHSQAGAAADDWPTPSNAPPLMPGVTGKELSESLRLGKKQKMHVEAWLQAASTGSAHTAPVLLPGAALPADGSLPAPGGVGPAAPKPRGRKGKAAGA